MHGPRGIVFGGRPEVGMTGEIRIPCTLRFGPCVVETVRNGDNDPQLPFTSDFWASLRP
jgi:hypothetical protein